MHILLVRHGETAWNREGRYQGRTDTPLSETGVEQVCALRDRLAQIPISVAVSSPLSRARSTAETVVAGRASIELDAGLVEISHGTWEGHLAREVEHMTPEMFARWRTAPGRDAPAGPGAESLGDVEARAWPVLEKLCNRLAPDAVALVAAHDAVNRVLLCHVLGMPLTHVWKFRQAPAALNVLAGPSLAELAVVRLNDCDHVAPLLAETAHRAL